MHAKYASSGAMLTVRAAAGSRRRQTASGPARNRSAIAANTSPVEVTGLFHSSAANAAADGTACHANA